MVRPTDGRSGARGKRQDVSTKLRKRQRPDEPTMLTPRVGLQRRVLPRGGLMAVALGFLCSLLHSASGCEQSPDSYEQQERERKEVEDRASADEHDDERDDGGQRGKGSDSFR